MKIIVSSFSDDVFINDIKKNIKLVNDFVDEGNMFIIATGKNITNVVKLIDNIDFKCSYYICNDGSTIFDSLLNVIYRVDIDQNIVRLIYSSLDNLSCVSDVKIDVSTGFLDDYMRATNKIVAKYENRKVASKVVNILNYKFDNIYAYLSNNYINIVNKKNSKGRALEYLLDYYNLKDNDIYTISKDLNDDSLSSPYDSYVVGNELYNFNHKVNSFEEALEKIAKN